MQIGFLHRDLHRGRRPDSPTCSARHNQLVSATRHVDASLEQVSVSSKTFLRSTAPRSKQPSIEIAEFTTGLWALASRSSQSAGRLQWLTRASVGVALAVLFRGRHHRRHFGNARGQASLTPRSFNVSAMP